MKKVLTISNIQNQRITRIPFDGRFYEAFKQPQNKGVWFIWGTSAGGKSSFTMQLAKEFARFENVLYNLLEEDTDDSDFMDRTEYLGMTDVKDRFWAQRYDYDELVGYLQKRKSLKVVIIDSATYFFKNFEEYLELKKRFKNKIFLITGHAQGKNPRSELETRIMYDARQKIFVNAYLASCRGRTIGPNGGHYIIWQEGYEKARGAEKQDNL